MVVRANVLNADVCVSDVARQPYRTATRAADALMRTETFHEAREYQRNPPSGR